jgi:1-acyl-sn-glycerol-3-phosphate acyltransferase
VIASGSFLDAAGYRTSTFVEVLHARSHLYPNRIAFRFLRDGEAECDSLTFQQLDQAALSIAAHLQATVQTGDRALLLYPSGLEFIAAFFGCLYAGVIAVPAYPPRANQNLQRLQAIVTDAEAAIVLTTAALLPNLEQRWAEQSNFQPMKWCATDAVSDSAAGWQKPHLNANSLAFLQYTSGSTGKPKGVMVSHGNLLHNERVIKQAFGHSDNTISVGWLPLFHDMGLVGNVLQPLYLGQTCTLMSPVDFLQKPLRWLQAISHYHATSSGGPNFAYELCVQKISPEQRQGLDLSCWDVAFTGAEPVRAETLDRFTAAFAPYGFRREAFYPCYGMAESTLFITGGAKTAAPVVLTVEPTALTQDQVILSAAGQTLVGCGQARLDQTAIVVDPQTRVECPQGRVGEIWASGGSVAQGYWNSDQTEAIFQAHLADGRGPFLRTGDLGFIQGTELFVTGRLKDVVIIRGRNHYPQDIELTIENSHTAIRTPGGTAAFALEVDGEERLVVMAEIDRSMLRKGGAELDEILTAIRAAIAQHHELQTQTIVLLKPGGLPKTSSGKIQRHACRTGFLAGTLPEVGRQENRDREVEEMPLETTIDRQTLLSQPVIQQQQSLQTWLIHQVAAHLKLSPQEINPQVPLLQYGLDSVEAISILAALEDGVGQRLASDLLEACPTIAAVSEAVVMQLDRLPTVKPQPTSSYNLWAWSKPVYQNWFQLQPQGLEHLPQNRPYLLAANHASHLDVGAIAVSLLDQTDQVLSLSAKDYFFNHGLKSWFFSNFLNLVPIDRQGSLSEALEALRHCEQLLAPRCPILIFPEGTRSRSGELQPFQPGIGLMALRLQVPIVPVYIDGAYQALPKGKLFPRSHPIRVTFGKPIEFTADQTLITGERCQGIADQVRSAMIQLRAQQLAWQKVEVRR